jgi:hypothetical protein
MAAPRLPRAQPASKSNTRKAREAFFLSRSTDRGLWLGRRSFSVITSLITLRTDGMNVAALDCFQKEAVVVRQGSLSQELDMFPVIEQRI